MPLYMDIHTMDGVSPEDIALAHKLDLEVQARYGVDYRRYWFNHDCGKVYCLVNAPNPEAAKAVHREAHGLMPEKIIEVDPELAEGFLGSIEAIPAGLVLATGSATQPEPAIRTVLFTDIVDSTALTQRLGDQAAMGLLRLHDTIVRSALHATSGREIKHTGDGIMAAFVSTAAAVRCAALLQNDLGRAGREPDALPLQVRVGLAAGEPVTEHGDLFGTTVQLAARLCSTAEPSQVLVSNVVVELCAGKGFVFDDRGEVPLKGFEHPARVHSLRWSDAGQRD